MKPSKILIGKYVGEEESIFLTGIEVSGRINRQKVMRLKTEVLKKKSHENIFSSLNMHSGENSTILLILPKLFRYQLQGRSRKLELYDNKLFHARKIFQKIS